MMQDQSPPSPTQRPDFALGIVFGLLTALIWGVQTVVSRQSVIDGLTAADVTLLRYASAGLALLPFALLRLKPFPVGRLGWRRALILTAIVGPSYSMLLVGGAHFAPALHSSVISPGLIPIFTALLAWLALGERVGSRGLGGMALLIAGIGLFSWDAILGTPTRAGAWIGDLIFVLVALLWAVFSTLARRWKADPVEVTLATAMLSLPLLPLVWLSMPVDMDAVAWRPVALQAVYQGLLVGVVALFLYTRSVAILGAGRATLFVPLVPVVTAGAAILLLGEWPTRLETLGMAVAVTGMVVALGAPRSPPAA